MCSGEQRGLLKEEEEISKHAQPTLGLEGTHSSFSLSLSLFFFFFFVAGEGDKVATISSQ